MKVKGKILVALALFVAVFAVLCIAALVISPWKGYVPFLVQSKITQWTGIRLHDPTANIGGAVRWWDKDGNLKFEGTYKMGKMDGICVFYFHNRGAIVGEYRNGEPWNGFCFMIPTKGWVAEYRQGRPWSGHFPYYDYQTSKDLSIYMVDGVKASEDTFKSHYHIPQNAVCTYGFAYTTN